MATTATRTSTFPSPAASRTPTTSSAATRTSDRPSSARSGEAKESTKTPTARRWRRTQTSRRRRRERTQRHLNPFDVCTQRHCKEALSLSHQQQSTSHLLSNSLCPLRGGGIADGRCGGRPCRGDLDGRAQGGRGGILCFPNFTRAMCNDRGQSRETRLASPTGIR